MRFKTIYDTKLRIIIVKIKTILNLGVLVSGLFLIASVSAGTIVQCGKNICSASFSIKDGNTEVGGGEFNYDSNSGDIFLSKDNISGDGAPNLSDGITWNLGATTGATASNYSFFFDLPIAISGPISTKSSVSYSLTSKTSAGAQIQGFGGNKIVQSWDVDAGENHFHLGGPVTSSSPAYTATDSISGDLAYDTMSVQVAFDLSAESIVGITGFVEQTPVPVPAAGWLMLTGLGFLTVRKRRTISAY